MQAAPITTAATAAGTSGADPNAMGGDLFAALMAALFNPAQMAPAALTPTGDPAAGGGDADPMAAQTGGGRQVLPVPGGGPDLVDRPTVPRVTEGVERPTVPAADDDTAILTTLLDGRRPALAPTGAEAKLAMLRQTQPAEAPAQPAPAPAAGAAIPAELLARPELVSVKGQAVPPPASQPTPSAAATLVAAQTQAVQGQAVQTQAVQAPVAQPQPLVAPQPLLTPAKPKPVAATETALDRVAVARQVKGPAVFTTAQLSAQEPAAAFVVPGIDESDAPESDADQAAPDPAAVAGREGPLHADAAHAPAPAVVRGAPQTVAHLSAEIARRLEAQTTRFQVELEPAGLGKVDVTVEIGAEGVLTAALSCDSVQAADLLRARSGELHAALEQAGFDVAGGLSFTADGAGHGHREQAGRDGRHTEQPMTLAALDEAPIAPPPPARAGPGRLDIRI